jgi:hypothetical protein
MGPITQVCLFGSLQKSLGDLYAHPVQLDLKAPTLLVEVLRSLKIPTDMVQMTMVNFKAVPKDSTIYPGDRVALFPKEYPVFADWKDLRF